MLRKIFKYPQFRNVNWRNLSSITTADNQAFVKVTEDHGVREIMLNHPKTLNSLSLNMMCALHEAICTDIDNIKLRCIVLSATGKIWSAGHNLKELQDKPDVQKQVFQKLTDIILEMRQLPVPVIAKVNGYAAAAGCQLVASCDIIVCSDKSKFSTPGANVGIFCSTPGVAISRVMPRPKSAYMLLTGLPINAEEALVAGMVSKVVPEDKLDLEIDQVTGAIRSKSRAVIALGKKFYYEQLDKPIAEAYKLGGKKMCENLQLPDSEEGVRSFVEKRSPIWKHN